MNRGQAAKGIHSHCVGLNLKPNSIGYLATSEANLISPFPNWSTIKDELNKGQGGELTPNQFGFVSFNAVHSSAALCVNTFAQFKQDLLKFSFGGFSGFKEATFEKKLPTGISTPNLDVYLETDKEIIGIESKFIEILEAKLPNHGGNLKTYINRFSGLIFQSTNFEKLIEHYISETQKMHLDVAQLIKHTLGLLNPENNPKRLKPVLVYIYWQPTNWKKIAEYKKHEGEVQEFATQINPFINFRALPYSDFMDEQMGIAGSGTHIQLWRMRYAHDL